MQDFAEFVNSENVRAAIEKADETARAQVGYDHRPDVPDPKMRVYIRSLVAGTVLQVLSEYHSWVSGSDPQPIAER